MTPFYVLWIFFALFFIREWYLYKDWIPTRATVIQEEKYQLFKPYNYQFTYEHDGVLYQGERGETIKGLKWVVLRYEVGKTFELKVNPENPSEYRHGRYPTAADDDRLMTAILFGIFIWWFLRWTVFNEALREGKKKKGPNK